MYFDTAVTAADVQAGTTLTSNGVAVPFTVEERTMAANSLTETGKTYAENYVGDTTIKIIPTTGLVIDKEYDLIITLSGTEVFNKYFKVTELYLADFSDASQIDGWWQNKNLWNLVWNGTDGRMTVENKGANSDSIRTLGITQFKDNFSNTDYTVEFDIYRNASSAGTPYMQGLRWQETAATDTTYNVPILPSTDYGHWSKYHAYINHYFYNGLRVKPNDGTKDTYISTYVAWPNFDDNNGTALQEGERTGVKYHWTYALQLGNKDLGIFVESTMADETVKEFKMADVNLGLDGGAFSFDVKPRTSEDADMFDLDNVHVTKVVEVARPVGAITFAAPSITYSTGSTVAEASTISGSVNVSNTYTTEMPAVVMMAAYDSTTGQMKNVDILYNDDLAVGTNSIPITSFNVEGADLVKVFAFDDLGTIVPYTEAQGIN